MDAQMVTLDIQSLSGYGVTKSLVAKSPTWNFDTTR